MIRHEWQIFAQIRKNKISDTNHYKWYYLILHEQIEQYKTLKKSRRMFSEPSEARTVPAKKYITTSYFAKTKIPPNPLFTELVHCVGEQIIAPTTAITQGLPENQTFCCRCSKNSTGKISNSDSYAGQKIQESKKRQQYLSIKKQKNSEYCEQIMTFTITITINTLLFIILIMHLLSIIIQHSKNSPGTVVGGG